MRYIVVTDLDGTLLDHHTYDFTPALGAIAKLQQRDIPLILNSSKTQAEITEIRQKLANQEPFICENGGLICGIDTDDEAQELKKVEYLGIPRKQFLADLAAIKAKLELEYRSFAEATIEDVVQWTGLSNGDACNAMNREATEPLLWQDTEIALDRFRRELVKFNLQCVKGGRFHHVMGMFDKASCFARLKEHYARHWQETATEIGIVALGDSQNDLPMLENADFAIIIPSGKGVTLDLNRNNLFIASQTAPNGWQEGIEYCFKNIF